MNYDNEEYDEEYEEEDTDDYLLLTIDDDGNASIRMPLPKITIEMEEDKLIQFVWLLRKHEDIFKPVLEDAIIEIEDVDDMGGFQDKINAYVDVKE